MYHPYKQANIHYTIQGKGRVVVFLHGFLESSNIWATIAESLAKQYRVICLDLPGHGKSDNLGYVHHMDMMANILLSVLSEHRIRRCSLIGHSMGGYVALSFAENHPSFVRGLCLLHSTPLPDNSAKKKDRDKAIRAVKTLRKGFFKQAISQLFMSKDKLRLAAEINMLVQLAQQINTQSVIACLEGMKARPNRLALFKKLGNSTIAILGEYDPIISFSEYQKRVGGNIVVLKETGHMGFFEAPVACEAAIKKFLRAT